MSKTTRLCELISKITITSDAKESVVKSIIDWTKNNRNLRFIQNNKRKEK